MNSLVNNQIERNRQTRFSWTISEGHRSQVMKLLLKTNSHSKQRRLCVLGAGNCNDLDLQELIKRFSTLHLVDIDELALHHAAHAQGVQDCKSIRLCGGVDITAALNCLENLSLSSSIPHATLQDTIHSIGRLPQFGMSSHFHVVVSTCILTQLLASGVDAIGQKHLSVNSIALALRNQHLRLMVDLLAPDGEGILISDIVSSLTCPQLKIMPDHLLPLLLPQLLRQGNFFTGTNPNAIVAFLTSDPVLSDQVSNIALVPPWRWKVGDSVRLVYALRFSRRPQCPN